MNIQEQPLDFDGDSIDVELLKQLERQSVREISKLRTHQRIELKVRVVLESGNRSQRREGAQEGTTVDLSKGGLRAIFPDPVAVGDLFRLSFDKSDLDLPTIVASCLRCVMVREDAFDCGFKFFTPLVIPDVGGGPADLLA